MKKEEILKKSKRENLWEDERSKQVSVKSEAYAAQIGNFILMLIILWKLLNKIPCMELIAVIFVQFGVSLLYKYKSKTENKLYLVAGIMILLASSVFLLDFFINGSR